MKNFVKTLALSAISLFCLTSCRFTAPSIEEEQTLLTEAGYAVTVTIGNEIDTEDQSTPLFMVIGIEECLYAKRDSDELYLLYFPSTEWASNANIFSNKLQQGQINEMIYLGTKQAIKDAKL